jgi:hypothetical protein
MLCVLQFSLLAREFTNYELQKNVTICCWSPLWVWKTQNWNCKARVCNSLVLKRHTTQYSLHRSKPWSLKPQYSELQTQNGPGMRVCMITVINQKTKQHLCWRKIEISHLPKGNLVSQGSNEEIQPTFCKVMKSMGHIWCNIPTLRNCQRKVSANFRVRRFYENHAPVLLALELRFFFHIQSSHASSNRCQASLYLSSFHRLVIESYDFLYK